MHSCRHIMQSCRATTDNGRQHCLRAQHANVVHSRQLHAVSAFKILCTYPGLMHAAYTAASLIFKREKCRLCAGALASVLSVCRNGAGLL